MRRILVDRARTNNRQKRKGAYQHIPLESLEIACELDDDRLLRINEHLTQLEEEHPERAELVKTSLLCGSSNQRCC